MLEPRVQTVSSKGQVVIPAPIRRQLDLKAKSKVWVITRPEQEEVVFKKIPKDPIEQAWGLLTKYGGRRVSMKELLEEKRREIAFEDRLIDYEKRRRIIPSPPRQ